MDSLESAITELRKGKPIIVVDDEARENEGDLVAAAQYATPELINFMITEARGLVCAPLSAERALQLGFTSMVPRDRNQEPLGCHFTVAVDAATGISTGISAHDRARTVQLLASPDATADSFVKPGHIFPLIAEPGGVQARAGHTEATVEILELAGLAPAGIICEILNTDGTTAHGSDLIAFAKRHDLVIVQIAELITLKNQRHPRMGYTVIHSDKLKV